MPVLSLETSTLVSSVALTTEEALVAEITLQTKLTHSERLMPHISIILEMADMTPKDLSAIAISIGPGSFTGLRIGLATAKALAYALQIPVIGVPTLDALAFGCLQPGLCLSPMLDAQKGNVYQAVFEEAEGRLRRMIDTRVISCKAALDELSQFNRPVVLMGEGAILYRQEIAEAGKNLVLAPPQLIIPRAGSVGFLGQQMLAGGIRQDVMTMEPLYIRRSEAEVLWERRQGTQL